MSENLINQYGRTELSLCSEYIKNIFTCRVFYFFLNFFISQDQTKRIIRNLTLRSPRCPGLTRIFSTLHWVVPHGCMVRNGPSSKSAPNERLRYQVRMQMALEGKQAGKHPEGTLKGSITGPGLEYFWSWWFLELPAHFISANKPWEV